jgi:membrane protein
MRSSRTWGDKRPQEEEASATSQQGAEPPQENERGRAATSPAEIPPKGWKDVLLRVVKAFGRDQIPLISAGITFYTLLALFPAMAALVALYGLFADVHDLQRQMAAVSPVVPKGALDLISQQLGRLVAAHKGGLSLTAAIGLLASIWSANGAVKALMAGLNVAYEQEESRGFFRSTLISLAFTVGLIVFGVVAMAVLGAGPFIDMRFGTLSAIVFNVASYAVIVVLLGLGLALLYRYGPSRHPAKMKWVSWGSGAAIVLWLAVSALFSLYVGNFAHYNRVYGSFGAVVAFMMWVYLSNMVVLLGAELNGEMEHQTVQDTTVGKPRPLGQRAAKMADSVGEQQGR